MFPQKPSKHGGARVSLSVVGLVARDRGVVLRPDAPALLMTIESAVAHATSGRSSFVLDRSGFLVLPRGVRVSLRTNAPACRVAMMSFHEPVFRVVARTYKKLGVDRARLDRWAGRLELLPRTLWTHEIVHRYVFEREVLDEHDNAATRFLETEVLKEIYFLFRDREEGADRASTVRRYSAGVERAITHVESRLFEAPDIRALASVAGASASTLLRAFRRELGCTPRAYWHNRRLDEALVLLRSGRRSIAELATHVGYENPTAFGFAFRRRFGKPPSAFVPRRPTRRAP
jgi:AraC-like DNA-binding protein